MPEPRPLTVAIAGGSASGKSTLARRLSDLLVDRRPVILNQDRYFRDWSEYPAEERRRVRTSNHPSAVLWDALTGQIKRLAQRQTCVEPVTGSAAAARGVPEQKIEPGDLVMVEGHLVLGCGPLRALMDLMVYVEVDPHERVLRRMLRDTTQGGMTLDEAVAWYRRDVIPNFPQHTEATRRHADLIVPFEGDGERVARFVAMGLRGMLEARKAEAAG